jgi:anaerobic selenocysteine-containing dehydrogenase
MVMQIARVPLRRINETLRLSLPHKLVQELGLRAGDYVDLVRDNGTVKLMFVKVEPPMEMAG